MHLIRRLRRAGSRLQADQSGLAMLEFAMSLPVLLGVGAYGLETANLALAHMRVSQLALTIADNASRAGETSDLAEKTIDETDINEIFLGASLQGREILENGRVVLSSLERNTDGGQWIHWQRCVGLKNHPSEYGEQDEGKTGTSFLGMGPDETRVSAPANGAVMFVELTYEFKPLISDHFLAPREIRHTAAFLVRERRDLSQLYNRGAATDIAECNKLSVPPVPAGLS